jgi:hypothetical protein
MGSTDGASETSVSPLQNSVKQYDCTPLSFAGPTNADRQHTRELEKVCKFLAVLVFASLNG